MKEYKEEINHYLFNMKLTRNTFLSALAVYLFGFNPLSGLVKLTILAGLWLADGGIYWLYLFKHTFLRDIRYDITICSLKSEISKQARHNKLLIKCCVTNDTIIGWHIKESRCFSIVNMSRNGTTGQLLVNFENLQRNIPTMLCQSIARAKKNGPIHR